MLCLILAACSTPSLPGPISQPAPVACDPRMQAPDMAQPAAAPSASIVQPVTPAEQAATQGFLQWVAAMVDWGKTGWAQADAGRAWCAAQNLNASLAPK